MYKLNLNIRKLLESLASSPLDYTSIVNKEGIYLYVSPSISNFLGINREDIEGKSLKDLGFSGDIILNIEKEIQQVLVTGRVYKGETAFPIGNTVSYYEVVRCPVYNDSGSQVEAVLNIGRDITEKKRLETELIASEQKYRDLFNALNDGVAIHGFQEGENPFTNFFEVNETYCKQRGYTRDELLKLTPLDIHPSQVADKDIKGLVSKIIANKELIFEKEHCRKDGTIFPVEINNRIINFQGKTACLSIIRDISQRKLMESKAMNSEKRYRGLFNNMKDGAVVHRFNSKDVYQPIIEVNNVMCDMLGYSKEELANLTSVNRSSHVFKIDVLKVKDILKDKGSMLFETYLENKGGKKIPVEINCHVFDLDNEPVFLSIVRDISERKISEERIKFFSEHDALTGLYNRGYFENILKKYKAEKRKPKGILICDLDGLKIINDTLGHEVGDNLIISAANVLVKCVPNEEAIIARIGGDEFAIIIKNNASCSAKDICERVRQSIINSNQNKDIAPLRMSIGYSDNEDGSFDIEGMLKQADDLMYKDKLSKKQDGVNTIAREFIESTNNKPFAKENVEHVQKIITLFAQNLGFSESHITDLRLFAKFHDIGKVVVPEQILLKKGSLSEKEWGEIRRHPEIGYRICKMLPDILHVPEWILKHHEWWNGEGYPIGLKGEEIPLECRILAIIDSYDAMLSERPYRRALTKEDAIKELQKGAGKQFDPDLTKRFVALISNY
ncbi:PAS domain S-box protein [Dendrosporobacter sp. 1207_IL3150]|uniref:PAS domain S-box protein n=1 Tax=Dendrosporobacter sp. 1207_IL3150 TaxID=3084054 RepID=UPI002FD9897F